MTAEDCREWFDYYPDAGVLVWKVNRRGRGGRCGMLAGHIHHTTGYLVVCNSLVHRVIWLHVYGEWPTQQVDHANGDKLDNRLSNLRLATASQNRANTPRLSNNTSGYKGASWCRQTKKWKSSIAVDYVRTHLGYFETREEAHQAYCAAARRAFGEFARTT